jgi:hypothetical protein
VVTVAWLRRGDAFLSGLSGVSCAALSLLPLVKLRFSFFNTVAMIQLIYCHQGLDIMTSAVSG